MKTFFPHTPGETISSRENSKAIFPARRAIELRKLWLLLLIILLAVRGTVWAAAITMQISSSPTNIVVTWNAANFNLESAFNIDGPWAIVPNATSPFNFTPTDSRQFFRVVSVLPGSNQPPVVVNDFYSMQHDQFLFVPQLGVLGNDSVADGNTLTSVTYSPAQHGTVNLFLDGSFLYQPNPAFVGTDYFEYLAVDGLQPSMVATVTITVTDSPPVVVNDSFGIQKDTTGGSPAPGVLRHASALAGDVLIATLGSSTTSGSLSLHTDGSFEYTPNAGFTGTDTFTYSANTGSSTSGVATVSLIVHGANGRPVAAGSNYVIAHDQILSVGVPGLLGDASDPDSDPLTATVATQPTYGTLALAPNGSFNYQPAPGFIGTDTFTWQASDGVTSSAPALVTVLTTNGVPVALADTFYMMPGQIFTNPAPGVLQNDTDPENDSLTATLVSGPGSGILTFNSDGSFTYQPADGFTGTNTFIYMATDGLSTSAVAVATLVVSHRPPVTQADAYGICQNQLLTVIPPGVLLNDSDPDGNPLTASATSLPLHGTLSFSTNGGFVYTPTTGYSGPDSFTYMASDAYASNGLTTVSLSVVTNCVPPLAVLDYYTTRPNATLAPDVYSGLLANDEDVNQCFLTAQLGSNVANGALTLNADGTFIYIPNPNFMGTDSFTYQAFNGSDYSGTVSVTITVTDAAPVSVSDSFDVHGTNLLTVYAPGVLQNDYDPDDGDVLTSLLVTGPHHGMLSLDTSGEFTYSATNGFIGQDSFTYRATDGTVTGAVTTVTINVGNQTPIAGDDEYTTVLNTPLTVTTNSGVLVNDTDGDDDSLTATLATGPAHAASFSLNSDGSFTYTPTPGFIGTDSFTYTASDGTINSASAQVTITVTATANSGVAHNAGPPPELDLQSVSFVGGANIASDTVRPLIGGPPHWLDSGDGVINPFIGERSYPYSYVRGNTLFARAVFRTPNRNAFRGADGQYRVVNLRGRLYSSGVPIAGAFVAPIRYFGLTPDRIGVGGTVYVDVRANVPFANTVNFLNLGIVWEYSLDGGATWTRCAPPGTPAAAAAGTSWHRIYLTWAVPQTWPLFETEVVYGSVSGAGLVNPNLLLARIWNNFKHQNARRADGKPLTYYHDWNVPTRGGVPDLLQFADGRCGQWAMFFIGTLQAQGLAPFNKFPSAVYTVPRFGFAQCQPTFMPFMVAKWNFGAGGVAGPNYAPGFLYGRRPFVDPWFPFENVMIVNPFDQFTPQCAGIVPPAPGHWGFPWFVPPQVDYVGGGAVNKGQNNPTPRPLFTDHAIVLFSGVFFDPSYGTIYANAQDMQNQAISGICYPSWETDWQRNQITGQALRDINGFLIPLARYGVLHIRPTPLWTAPLIYICPR